MGDGIRQLPRDGGANVEAAKATEDPGSALTTVDACRALSDLLQTRLR